MIFDIILTEFFFPSSKSTPVSYPINIFSRDGMDSLTTNVCVGCATKNLNENQKYMIGFAWVIPNELELFVSMYARYGTTY